MMGGLLAQGYDGARPRIRYPKPSDDRRPPMAVVLIGGMALALVSGVLLGVMAWSKDVRTQISWWRVGELAPVGSVTRPALDASSPPWSSTEERPVPRQPPAAEASGEQAVRDQPTAGKLAPVAGTTPAPVVAVWSRSALVAGDVDERRPPSVAGTIDAHADVGEGTVARGTTAPHDPPDPPGKPAATGMPISSATPFSRTLPARYGASEDRGPRNETLAVGGPRSDLPSLSESGRSDAELGWQRLYRDGHRAQERGRLDEASQLYRRAAALNPNHAAILYDLGYVLQLQGRDQAAIDEYTHAIQLNPRHQYALYNLGWLKAKAGDRAAIPFYRLAIAVDPESRAAAWAREQLDDLLSLTDAEH